VSACLRIWRQLEPTLEKDCEHERSLRKNGAGHRASRGIGRASALALAKTGAQVVVHYGRGAQEAEAVVAEIHNIGGRADMIAADLAAADGAHTLAKRVRGIVGGRLDILVLNAGVSKAATIEDTTVEDFDHLFAVNVRAPFFLV
jgi:NAD(P)-dependent dehydrogenase (short-subunit alcohol dehydrogenase family)